MLWWFRAGSPWVASMPALDELTVDLLIRVFEYLDGQSVASLSTTCWAQLVVNDLLRATSDGQRALAPAGFRPPFGLGYIDRPRFLRPGERNELVVSLLFEET
jgi:hypothetical protein